MGTDDASYPVAYRHPAVADHYDIDYLPPVRLVVSEDWPAYGHRRDCGRYRTGAISAGAFATRGFGIPFPGRVAGQHHYPEPVRADPVYVCHRYGAGYHRGSEEIKGNDPNQPYKHDCALLLRDAYCLLRLRHVCRQRHSLPIVRPVYRYRHEYHCLPGAGTYHTGTRIDADASGDDLARQRSQR